MKVPFLIFCLLLILLNNCSVTDPVFRDHEMILTTDAEVTETWITLETDGPVKNAIYTVKRDSITIFEGKLDKSDTLIHDESLEPSTNYNYSAYARKSGEMSGMVYSSCTTMDTTSHNFTWELLSFGNKSPSELNDVAIINENDIWAVGHIFVDDSTYNAIHWNGSEWEYFQIPVRQYNSLPIASLNAIFVLSQTNIWITSGSTLLHWNGSTFVSVVFMRDYRESDNYSPLKRIWALDDNNIYMASGGGNIVYYNGETYKELPKITDAAVSDLWSSRVSETPDAIYGAVSNKYSESEHFIMKIEDETISEDLGWRETDAYIYSLWFKAVNRMFTIGTHLTVKYEYNIFTKDRTSNWKDIKNPVNDYLLHSIRGTDINDIFVCGDFFILAHYNGRTWRKFDEFWEPGTFYKLDYKDDIMVAVGIDARYARMIIMKKK